MATHSTIAVEKEDGSVEQVYAHWDGYIERNGVILQYNYNDYDKIVTLVGKGAILVLSEELDGCERPDDEEIDKNVYENTRDYLANFPREEYNYFWKYVEKCWYVNQLYLDGDDWTKLEVELTSLSDD